MADEPPGGAPRTVIVPNPGGRRRMPDDAVQPRAAPAPLAAVAEGEPPRPGVNRLVDAAAPLFSLVVFLRGQIEPMDVDALRDRILMLIRAFEKKAEAAGVERKIANVARYAISATIDDVMLSLPWAFEAGWHNRTLVAVLHDEVIGGDRFFELLESAERDPRRYAELIELMYLCLSLGFQGRYRRDRQMLAMLDQIRGRVFNTIADVRGGIAARLSLRWKGVETERRRVRELIPVWLAAALSVAAAAGLFFYFVSAVGEVSAGAIARAGDLRPETEPTIVRYAPRSEPQQIFTPEVSERVAGFLEPEIEEGLVTVSSQGSGVNIRVASEAGGRSMFPSAQAVLQESYRYPLERVAKALDAEEGRIVVVGHSDNIPISTARFPSNFHLSLERAQAVADFIAERLADPTRVTVDGRGEAEPIADNATPEGRAKNRRVELALIRE